jgi:hypothetical protein
MSYRNGDLSMRIDMLRILRAVPAIGNKLMSKDKKMASEALLH